MGQKLLNAKLERAAGRLQPALRLLGQLRATLAISERAENEELAKALAQAQTQAYDLEAELYSVEAAVGVVTQATLFDDEEAYTGMSTEEAIEEREYRRGLEIGKEAAAKERQAIQDEQRDCDDVPASATITFLVDCDYCGQECEAAGNQHTCQHCGKTFDIVD